MQKKTTKMKKTSSFEDTDTDQESSSSASRAPLHHSKYATHTDTHPSSTVCYTDTWERCPLLVDQVSVDLIYVIAGIHIMNYEWTTHMNVHHINVIDKLIHSHISALESNKNKYDVTV